jgi:chromosome segregation ATPase
MERIKSERESAEQKLELKRKTFRDSEANLSKHISTLEREKAILQEKHEHLISKKADSEDKYDEEIKILQVKLATANASSSKERDSIVGDLDKLKSKIIELEKENSDVGSNYEKDKALWEGKHNFLET